MTPEKMEKRQRTKIVNTAKSYLGAKQGSPKHKRIINIFNTVKPDGWAMTYTAYWCAASVSAWAIETFGKDKAKKFFPLSANCVRIITLAKELKIWKESDAYKTPEPGDWILYDWDDKGKGDCTGDPDHVGLVEKCEDGKITVIEGNMKNSAGVRVVGRRVLSVNGKYIRGFVLPKYDKIVKHSKRWYFRETTDEIYRYMRSHKFKYEPSWTKNALTWDGAKKKKTSNCTTFLCYALQQCGLFDPGMYFWVNGKKFNYRGKGTKKRLEQISEITHPNAIPANAKLVKGDICCYDGGHAQEFAGWNAKGQPLWYSYGSSDVGDKEPKQKPSYDNRKIATRIRIKKE